MTKFKMNMEFGEKMEKICKYDYKPNIEEKRLIDGIVPSSSNRQEVSIMAGLNKIYNTLPDVFSLETIRRAIIVYEKTIEEEVANSENLSIYTKILRELYKYLENKELISLSSKFVLIFGHGGRVCKDEYNRNNGYDFMYAAYMKWGYYSGKIGKITQNNNYEFVPAVRGEEGIQYFLNEEEMIKKVIVKMTRNLEEEDILGIEFFLNNRERKVKLSIPDGKKGFIIGREGRNIWFLQRLLKIKIIF